ncbi:MAG: low molecular weight phosphotyrosine protein phosphatase [Clostridia bacterium]|nr:low molecular weight phosphotyrosine protein phosphatase [Clostridia bacterium]
MIKIMFVCHGNICRSPMAEFVLKDMLKKRGLDSKIQVTSSATSTEEIGNDIHRGTRQILDKYSIPYTRREAVQLARADYAKYDYFIGMDAANVRNMHRIFGSDPEGKIMKLLDLTEAHRDVADPWYTGNFEVTYRDVTDGCEALLEHIIKTVGI